jgi:hypothetical protein
VNQSTILLSGMIAGVPHQGGATWAVLQYLLGLRSLGHEVLFVEPVDQTMIQPAGVPLDASVNADYFKGVVRDFGFEDAAALLLTGSTQTVGLPYEVLRRVARRADAVINISGTLTDENLIAHAPVRVYLDLDPAFNQLWQAVEGIDMRFDGHTHFATVGQAVGHPGCAVPTCGREWIPTLPPVVLASWPVAESIAHDALTTVANWRGYGSVDHDGVLYGQKAHSLRAFMSLPTLTDETFVLALAIHSEERKDLVNLMSSGWGLVDPAEVAGTPEAYRLFIQGSKGELGIAKSGYVLSRSGWFGDRSACYLASGRPVIAQDTGFNVALPTGEGLFCFQTTSDVLAAIGALRDDYTRHSRAARAIAEEHLDSAVVLPRLLERVGIS